MKLLKILFFNDSRKVGFGLWLFAAAGGFLWYGKIDGQSWMLCMGCCTALVGGGTIADTWMGKGLGNDPTPPAAQ